MTLKTVPLAAHASYRQLCPAVHVAPLPPAFVFGAFPAELAKLFHGRTRVPAAGVFTSSRIEVGAGLLLRADDALIQAPALNWQTLHIEQALQRYGSPEPEPVHDLAAACALIVTPGYRIFGHWLADILPRLGLLEAAGHDLDGLLYLMPDDTPDFALEMLRLLGFGPDRLVRLTAGQVIRPRTLLLPTFPHNGRQFTSLMARSAAMLRARIEARFGALNRGGTPPSILVSRQGWGARRMAGRAAFEAAAVRQGFVAVSPETLPMLDQFRLFAGAREIIGEYGSALHGSLFSTPGTVVCALRGTQPHPAFIQSGLGDALGQPTGYVFGVSSDDPSQREFSIRLEDIQACLDMIFRHTRPPLEPRQDKSTSDGTGS